jgi:protocatechuate 3,4-dioxygenase beta subunit/predicted aconitase with swiveling domain
VRLASSESHLGFPPITATDNDGRYEFRRLPSGPYTVVASRPGFVTREYGQRRDSAAGEPIDLRPGEWLERIDISLPLTGAIAGRLVDDGGDPVEGASVRVMQVRYESGRRRLVDVSSVRPRRTDDLGRYRIYGLQPGEYIVSAVVGQMFPALQRTPGFPFVIPQDPIADLSGYATTYLPGTPTPGDAQRVTVELSQNVLGADFALVRVPMARVAGTAFDAAGKPASGNVLMTPTGRSGFVASAPVVPQVQSDGAFEFQNVAPGEYIVQASSGLRTPTTEGEFAAEHVTVNGTDITGLILRMSRGSAIEGHITLEGQGTPDVVHAIELTRAIALSARPIDVDRSPPIGNSSNPSSIHIFSDLTFRTAGISGPRVFRLTRAPREWALKAVLLNGVDVTDTPIAFGTSEQSVSDLEVVLTDRASEVSGRVTDTRGRGVADCTVVVFATASSFWSQPESRFLAMARSDRDGTFGAGGLPPGQYYVAAVDRLLEGEWQDPDVLASLVPGSTSVILAEGQKLSVTLRPIAR